MESHRPFVLSAAWLMVPVVFGLMVVLHQLRLGALATRLGDLGLAGVGLLSLVTVFKPKEDEQ